LHWACYRENLEIANLLIENEINLDVLDNEGMSPIHLACYHNHVQMILLLIDKGCDVRVIR